MKNASPNNSNSLPQKPHSLHVDFCNIRSLNNKIVLVKDYCKSSDVDLLFLTESWLSPALSNSVICPNDYNTIRSDRIRSKGGGVVLFYKRHLKISNLCEINSDTSNDDLNFEFVCIELTDGKRPLRFLCMYVPPSHSRCKDTVKNICKTVSRYISASVPFYVLGDFNMPKIDWTNLTCTGGPAQESFLTFCIENCLSQCINEASRPFHTDNILDLLFCNNAASSLLLSYSVKQPLTSTCDHSLISFAIQLLKLISSLLLSEF